MKLEFFPPSSRSAEQRRRQVEKLVASGGVTSGYLEFGYDYFDNPELDVGYGSYRYDGRYADVARAMADHYGLKPGDRVLEIGCAKGYLLVEFQKLGMGVAGMDVSEYAVENAHPEVRPFITCGPASDLPFPEGHFDLVIGKEVLPHVPLDRLDDTLRECIRVSKGNLFFEIQCGRTPKELEYMRLWDATHQVIETPEWWDNVFAKLGYPGDVHYKVLIPEGNEG